MTTRRGAVLAALALSLIGCSADRPITTHAGGDPTADAAWEAAAGVPEDEGLDSHVLLELTEWIRDHPVPMFSFLVSRNGRLVYELYTSALTREHAHYLMSVTKSVVSALVGIAIDRGLVSGPDASIAEILPRRLFASDADVARFRRVTIRHVLGMSALDAPDPPRVNTPEARARERQFWAAPNRVAFALAQPLLTRPGREYQYNDVTPMLASGVVQYASGKSALEFAEETLFAPMRFRHHEWMHQDASGFDMGGYGLRLRPIDMQKFGVLYLRGGDWGARTLVPRAWVERSFSPWNRSRPDARDLDYGWFWWTYDGRSGWTTHSAIGWKGQRIAVLPRQRLVVTMTGAWEDGDENRVFNDLVDRFVVPSIRGNGPRRHDPAAHAELVGVLAQVRDAPSRIAARLERRMIPTVAPKEGRVPFRERP